MAPGGAIYAPRKVNDVGVRAPLLHRLSADGAPARCAGAVARGRPLRTEFVTRERMVKHDPAITRRASPISAAGVFSPYACDVFAECYPETPHKLRHTLGGHPLVSLDALAQLGEALPGRSTEYWRGGEAPPSGAADGESAGVTIRAVGQAGGCALIKNIEQEPTYRRLIEALIDELRPAIERRTGRMSDLGGCFFVAGPGAASPYHFDPEHSIMLQLSGAKSMTQYPPGNPAFASDEAHEACHTAGRRVLAWRDEFAPHGIEWRLDPGDAVYVPALAPHQVRVGPAPAISLSINWRSEWSHAEADARAFNAQLRRLGIKPMPPERWPGGNKAKALAWRAWRKFVQRRR